MAVKKITGRLYKDSGASLNDGLTSDATLTGITNPGAVVTFTEGRKVLGTVKADGSGNWTFRPAGLADGKHSIVATASDGTKQTASTTLGFTLDTKASVTQKLVNDTGSAGSDGVTKDPTLTGKTDPGATVTLTEGGKLIGTATADRNGNWTFKPAGLADGQHSIVATTKDLAGNTATSTLSFKLDTKASITERLGNDSGTSATDGITNDATLVGTAEAGALVVITEGFRILGSVRAGNDGKWSFKPTGLSDGQHSITAATSDAAGNIGITKFGFTLDTKVPGAPSGIVFTDDAGAVKGKIASGATTDDATPTLVGKAEAGATVSVYHGVTLLGSSKAGADGSWSFTPGTPLTDGSHSFYVQSVDAAGNASPPSAVYAITVAAGPITDPSRLPTTGGTAKEDTVIYSGATQVGGATPYILPEAIENFDATGTGAVNIAANALNNVIGLGMGAQDKVDLSSGGSDRVTGNAAELHGASISGFGTDDTVVVEGASAVKILKIEAGSAVLHLDTNGDNTADTTIRLVGEGLDGSKLTAHDFEIAAVSGESVIKFAPTDDPAPTYSISDAMVAEGGKLLFTVSSSAPVASDTLVETVGHGSVTIKANETSAVLEVQTRDNATYGANPEVVVRLAEAFGGDTGTGQVADDEAAPTYSISDAMVAEGGKLLFTVSSSAPVASDTLVETVGHGSVTIKANETSAVLEVQTRDNATYGANPEVMVR
ncbi:Ig-like domain-containing protein, partial [Roseomonas chloroacetimidivorans]|uniref:Ig-like domain-containing protein n=1 Tax=Roseomonas chloroacetimidivorans TaxID=1766656 RepID=UPI003C78A690